MANTPNTLEKPSFGATLLRRLLVHAIAATTAGLLGKKMVRSMVYEAA
ncbi:MAG: hypothetical protein IJU76_12935 [Desulfovibrionaceae bacterium]|nr:hypothetical protein [Desulfovibrionaceae bacterium]